MKRRSVLAFFEKLPRAWSHGPGFGAPLSRKLQRWVTRPLIPPAYVKPYVKRQKNDAADAEAFASGHQGQHWFVHKTPEQQSGLVLHRTRHLSSSADRGDQCNPGHLPSWNRCPVGRHVLELLIPNRSKR